MLPPLLGQLEEGLPGHITHPGAALRLGGLVAPGTPHQAKAPQLWFCINKSRPHFRCGLEIGLASSALGRPLVENYG